MPIRYTKQLNHLKQKEIPHAIWVVRSEVYKSILKVKVGLIVDAHHTN